MLSKSINSKTNANVTLVSYRNLSDSAINGSNCKVTSSTAREFTTPTSSLSRPITENAHLSSATKRDNLPEKVALSSEAAKGVKALNRTVEALDTKIEMSEAEGGAGLLLDSATVALHAATASHLEEQIQDLDTRIWW